MKDGTKNSKKLGIHSAIIRHTAVLYTHKFTHTYMHTYVQQSPESGPTLENKPTPYRKVTIYAQILFMQIM